MSSNAGPGNAGLLIALGFLLLLSLANSYYIYSLEGEISALKEEVRELSGPLGLSVYSQSDPPRGSITMAQKSIPIVAVSDDEIGVMGKMNLRLIPGSNDILIDTNPFSEPEVQYAVKKAVAVARSRYPGAKLDMDFVFNFTSTRAQLIGGESAGAAAAILTIAALEDRDIKKDAVITGTINEDGSIGQIGSVLEKTKAVSDAGYKYFLIPEGQADVIYYERQVERRSTDLGFDIMRSKYVPRTLNISQAAYEELGLNVIEVSNIDEALPYFFEG